MARMGCDKYEHPDQYITLVDFQDKKIQSIYMF